ncbi:hypothetical protein [Rhodopseudomonas palustris]|uniref:Uncharacterized protein n=1 Tax=Rhodopseudomonas palustris (strain BisB18) TaxID=316056 RepID=Q219V9_RHOPB
MTSESSFNYFEFILLAMFVAAWLILEWQGKRLDKKREAEKAKRESEKR